MEQKGGWRTCGGFFPQLVGQPPQSEEVNGFYD